MKEQFHKDRHPTELISQAQEDDGFISFLLEHTEQEAPAVDEHAAFMEVKKKLEQPRSSYFWMKVAASVALIAICSFTMFTYFQQPETITVSSTDSRLQVTFPDGSIGILNESTSITYLEKFEDVRRVHLITGEIFFDVQKSNKPFVINAGKVDIKVLGTSFNVLRNREQIRLDVKSGLVDFGTDGSSTEVPAGLAAIYDKKMVSVRQEEGNVNAFSWMSGQLVFDNVNLSKVLEELSSHYKVKFKLENEGLSDCKVSATFENEELSQVLQTLNTLLNLTISKKGKTIHISGEGC